MLFRHLAREPPAVVSTAGGECREQLLFRQLRRRKRVGPLFRRSVAGCLWVLFRHPETISHRCCFDTYGVHVARLLFRQSGHWRRWAMKPTDDCLEEVL